MTQQLKFGDLVSCEGYPTAGVIVGLNDEINMATVCFYGLYHPERPMLKFEMVGDSEMRAALAGCSKKIDDEIKSSMAFVVLRLQKQVKTHKLLGQVLHRRTGNLRANIVRDSWQDGGLTVGVVGIASGAP